MTRFTLAVVVSRLATHQFCVVESSLGCIDYSQEWLPSSKKFRQSFLRKGPSSLPPSFFDDYVFTDPKGVKVDYN